MTRVLVLLAATTPGLMTITIPTTDQSASVTLRVLCYNIHHGRGIDDKVNLPRIAKVITSVRPDLVALQEVDYKTRRTDGVDQTAELMRLTGLQGKFGKAIDYQGGEYGQAILSQFPMDAFNVHNLPGQPNREQRIAVEARVCVGGQELAFVSTHLDHQLSAEREKQATELNRLFGTAKHPVILAGDLNAIPTSKPLEILSPKWSMATSGPNFFTIPVEKPTRQIDYILYRPADQFRTIEAQVFDERIASDHRPVFAVLEWKP
jgi:endonuclease/exonuclease/phosphatase family metal-dependent hydrolase